MVIVAGILVGICTLWFQLIVTPQGIEKVMIQLKDTPTKEFRNVRLEDSEQDGLS